MIKMNTSMTTLYLKEWSKWYLQQEQETVIGLGFPKMSSFMREYLTTNNFNHSFDTHFEEADENVKLIHYALMRQAHLYHVARISYCFCRKCPAKEKAELLLKKYNVKLGNTPNTSGIKYHVAEQQLHAYLEGVIFGVDFY